MPNPALAPLIDHSPDPDLISQTELERQHNDGTALVLGSLATTNGTEHEPGHGGEFVKQAPGFHEQVADDTRTNIVSYVPGQKTARGTHLDQSKAVSLTEHEALQGLKSFLVQTAALDDGSRASRKAETLQEDLVFIGEREYQEATTAIATNWKQQLSENAGLQICAICGVLRPDMVKSDQYMLDEILKNFSDEELTDLSGRLVQDPGQLRPDNESVEVIVLDDWTNSGRQLTETAASVINAHPGYAGKISVQLIAASPKRLKSGVTVHNMNGEAVTLPVSAYFAASPKSGVEAVVTGAHSSMDFGFENEFGSMVYALDKAGGSETTTMPPLTNVARPYRQPGYRAHNIARLQRL